ncbi:MAG: glycosyl hydrolase family protein [Candidatus Sulfotelmatobacter sp.]|jgi:glycosyl hydrolase family 79
MDRRTFIHLSAATLATLHLPKASADERPASLRVTLRPDRLGNRIENDFTGLSYESAQLGNPNFFSGDNAGLIGFVRRLGDSGVLRIGGNTSEYCYWAPNPGKETWVASDRVVPPDTGRTVPPSVNITPQAIRNLRDFIDATGWKLIYGLNMGTGSVEDAAAEAAYVMDVTGPKLLALQLCNEPDLFYRNAIRKSDYDFAQFAEEWQRYYGAIRARVPNAPFAGPDTVFNNSWLAPFAQKFKNEVRFITQHYYAEGPPTDPSMTLERLLRPDPKLQEQFDGMKKTVQETGLPFRLAETNSCYSAGKLGVSDTFASALWGTGLMYQLASEGGAGINFHGGGYGWYTPIAGTKENGFTARPLYYGMLLFAEAGAGQLTESRIEGLELAPLLNAYGLRSSGGSVKAVILNKNLDCKVQLKIDSGTAARSARVLRLHAPRADDTTDVTFGGASVGGSGNWSTMREEKLPAQDGIVTLEMPAATAALVTFSD